MTPKKKALDLLPEEFDSYEQAAEFWDTHDTTEYLQDSRPVKMAGEFRGRRYEVEIEPGVIQALRKQARKQGVPVSRLANDMLRQQLTVHKVV